MPRPLGQRRIFQYQRIEQRVAHGFHVSGRIVQVTLNLVVLEQRERDLVLDNVVIHARLGRQRFGLHVLLQSCAKLRVIVSLAIERGRTDIVELFIQVLALVAMQPAGRRRHRRERQRCVNELFSQRREAVLQAAATCCDESGHKQNHLHAGMTHGSILHKLAAAEGSQLSLERELNRECGGMAAGWCRVLFCKVCASCSTCTVAALARWTIIRSPITQAHSKTTRMAIHESPCPVIFATDGRAITVAFAIKPPKLDHLCYQKPLLCTL